MAVSGTTKTTTRKAKTTTPAKQNAIASELMPVEKDAQLRVTVRVSEHTESYLFEELAKMPTYHRARRIIALAAMGYLFEQAQLYKQSKTERKVGKTSKKKGKERKEAHHE